MSRDYPSNSDDIIDVRSVIARVEELREERKPKIVVGYNMPGYLPDAEPSEYLGWEDARSGLVYDLREYADEEECTLDAHDYDMSEDEIDVKKALITDLRALADKIEKDEKDEEFGATFGKYHFFMTDTGETVIEDEDEEEELKNLEEFLYQIKGFGGDHQWEGYWYPVTLVRDSYFIQYAEQLAEEIGAINSNASWPNNSIDWEAAANSLKDDYSTAEFDGETYWFRSA